MASRIFSSARRAAHRFHPGKADNPDPRISSAVLRHYVGYRMRCRRLALSDCGHPGHCDERVPPPCTGAGRHEGDSSLSGSAWAKQKQTEPGRSIGKPRVAKAGGAGGTSAVRQLVSYTHCDDSAAVDRHDEQQVRHRVSPVGRRRAAAGGAAAHQAHRKPRAQMELAVADTWLGASLCCLGVKGGASAFQERHELPANMP